MRTYKEKPHILLTLFKVWLIWRRVPMLRLGQLMACTFEAPSPIFYTTDEDLILKLNKIFPKKSTRSQW